MRSTARRTAAAKAMLMMRSHSVEVQERALALGADIPRGVDTEEDGGHPFSTSFMRLYPLTMSLRLVSRYSGAAVLMCVRAL